MSNESKVKLKDGTTIKVTGGGKSDNASISIYSGDYRNKNDHSATHVNINTKTGKGSIVEHGNNHSDKTKTDTSCYLTTACLKHYQQEFDDNCYELNILRMFRDLYVTQEDINHYYEIAPFIIDAINNRENNYEIYEYIYRNIILPCVFAIEINEYEFAYNTYKNSILALEKVLLNEENNYIRTIKRT